MPFKGELIVSVKSLFIINRKIYTHTSFVGISQNDEREQLVTQEDMIQMYQIHLL